MPFLPASLLLRATYPGRAGLRNTAGHSEARDALRCHGGLDPRINDELQRAKQYFRSDCARSWIAGSSPAMTIERLGG
jgi:hypothetical protein